MTELVFEGLVNARDLGGLPVAGGGSVRSGRLYRSETPQLMTAADVARAVGDLGVTRVIDLRGPRGRGSGPLGADGRGLVIDYFDLAGGHEAQHDLTPDGFLPNQLGLGASVVGMVLKELVAADGATLIHCHTGKDRTGYMVAMILAVLGVPDAEIVADYCRSIPVFETMMANLRAAALAVTDDAPAYARHAPSPAGVTAMLERLRAGWASADDYLVAHGVPAELPARARSVLVTA
ncbi:MAG: tyrosine-protein phosphatase [Acidimicrobiia bacterium]|nr:tyrosine-protein phosphatase [Acidimicrobiia bacterium]